MLCKKLFKFSSIGFKAVESQMHSEKHKAAAKSREKMPVSSLFRINSFTDFSSISEPSSENISYYRNRPQYHLWVHCDSTGRDNVVPAQHNKTPILQH